MGTDLIPHPPVPGDLPGADLALSPSTVLRTASLGPPHHVHNLSSTVTSTAWEVLPSFHCEKY